MSKQYFVIIFICAVLHKNTVLSTDTKTYAQNGIVNNTTGAAVTGAGNNSTNNTASSIIAEGGQIKLNPELVFVHHGRENVVIVSSTQKPDSSNVTVSTNATTNSTKTNTTVSASVSTTTILPAPLTTSSITKSTTLLSETSLEVHGDSKIKPRKGVDMNMTPPESNGTVTNSTVQTSTTPVITNATVIASNTTVHTTIATTNHTTTTTKASTTPSTTTVKPKKPTVTFSSEDEPPLVRAPPKVIMNNKVLQPKNVTGPLPILVAGGEQVISNRRLKKEPDYVLPIVLTILAVPLLAITLTVVYKRGAEWWQHRHYRRMDFLIDGMYNN